MDALVFVFLSPRTHAYTERERDNRRAVINQFAVRVDIATTARRQNLLTAKLTKQGKRGAAPAVFQTDNPKLKYFFR